MGNMILLLMYILNDEGLQRSRNINECFWRVKNENAKQREIFKSEENIRRSKLKTRCRDCCGFQLAICTVPGGRYYERTSAVRIAVAAGGSGMQ